MVNGQKLNLDYLGFEIEEEAVWFYMEALKVPSPHNVQIRNEVLIEHFEGQQNIVNFYLEKSPKSLILYKGQESGKINF
jgi:hypothetical protein